MFCVCDVYKILAPERLSQVSTVSCRLTLKSLHFTLYGIFIQHNTALQTALEQHPIFEYTLRHLPLPDFDDDDDDDNELIKAIIGQNACVFRFSRKPQINPRWLCILTAFLNKILNHFSTYTSSKWHMRSAYVAQLMSALLKLALLILVHLGGAANFNWQSKRRKGLNTSQNRTICEKRNNKIFTEINFLYKY